MRQLKYEKLHKDLTHNNINSNNIEMRAARNLYLVEELSLFDKKSIHTHVIERMDNLVEFLGVPKRHLQYIIKNGGTFGHGKYKKYEDRIKITRVAKNKWVDSESE